MNIMSFNMCGCGISMKRKRLRKMISKGQEGMIFIQETKTMNMNDKFVSSLWGNEVVEWTEKIFQWCIRGIFTIWKKDVILPLFSFKAEGLLGLYAIYNRQVCYFMNGYSSCFLNMKIKLWSELLVLKIKFGEGWWCLGGDFNTKRDK